MPAHMFLPMTLTLPALQPARGRPRTRLPDSARPERRSSPGVAERVRPLTRGQVADRLCRVHDVRSDECRARAELLGCANLIRPLSEEALVDAVDDVLSSPRYREAARRASSSAVDVADPVQVCHDALA